MKTSSNHLRKEDATFTKMKEELAKFQLISRTKEVSTT